MQRPIDRRVAAGGFACAAIVMLCAVAFTRAPLPEIDVRDPAAARDLVALMRAGEHGRWITSYEFTRTLANGRALHQVVREGRGGNLHVVVAGTTMSIQHGARSFDCSVVGDRAGCTRSATGKSLPDSEVLRVAVAIGAYDVVRRPDATIAGLPARCFRVRGTGEGGLPDLGVETDECLSAGGVPLRLLVVRPPGTVDDQVATHVQAPATTGAVVALAKSFAPDAPTSGR